MIHFTHVTKSYEDNWKALNNVTFRVNKGEFATPLPAACMPPDISSNSSKPTAQSRKEGRP